MEDGTVKMNNDLKRDYKRYERLCKKYNEEILPLYKSDTMQSLNSGWLMHYDELLAKEGVHYNR